MSVEPQTQIELEDEIDKLMEEFNNIKSKITDFGAKLKQLKKIAKDAVKEKASSPAKKNNKKIKRTTIDVLDITDNSGEATSETTAKEIGEKEVEEEMEEEMEEEVEETEVKIKKPRKPKAKKVEPQPPSGIITPTLISDELCAFLGKPSGIKMLRVEVTQEINTYIRNNKLQNLSNKQIIVPNESLKKILNLEEGQQLTYFNIQSMINKHFIHSDI
jgi:chromatin remodeling complex protein RSC6